MRGAIRILRDLAKERRNLPPILKTCKDGLMRVCSSDFGKLRGEAIEVLEYLAGSEESIGPLIEAGLRPRHLSSNAAIRNGI